MKKLNRVGGGRNSTVHPSESEQQQQLSSFVPAAILTLAASLSPHDREVLAYLLLSSASSDDHHTAIGTKGEHPLCFKCYCFRCYTAYWVRWDSSPNRQLIHQIIDAFEDHQHHISSNNKNKKKQKKKKIDKRSKPANVAAITTSNTAATEDVAQETNQELLDHDHPHGIEKASSSSSVRKLVSFIGQRMWNLWIQ